MSWSHAFRQILGYHDALDFPNQLDAWSELLHPEDKDRVMTLLLETVADKTNTTKFSMEYRLKLQNGPYQWFRTSAEVIRRLDGTASRVTGIIRNIAEEKQSRMQAQRAEAFHRAFTNANLCEYYVNLEQNTFDAFKVEASLMTAFEQSPDMGRADQILCGQLCGRTGQTEGHGFLRPRLHHRKIEGA